MNPIYDSHILRWKNVNWPVDSNDLLKSIGQCRGREVLARVRQSGRLVEVQSPNGDLTQRLEQNQVDLKTRFDLEVITREPGIERAAEKPVEGRQADEFIDRNDFNCLQWNGERGVGNVPAGRMRNTPMFFRSNGMNADLLDLYAGQTLFMILNGGSLEGFDWSRLKKPGICTFGVNNGAHLLRPTFWTSVDDPTRFLRSIWADPTITKFIPMSHFQKPIWDVERGTFSESRVKDFPNVYGYRRNEAFQPSQWLYEDTINWGNHSKRGGGRSVMLATLRIAFLLGFRRVCLLGCDFYMDDNNRYWFAEERSRNAISNNQNSYRLMMGFFEQLQQHFLAAGFHVVNCNPKSQLKVFPMADLDVELAAAQVDTSATTEGMYVDRYKDHKQQQAKEKKHSAKPVQAKAATSKAPSATAKSAPTVDKPAKVQIFPTRLAATFLEHLTSAVAGATLLTDPFPHLELQSVFSQEVYREMLLCLPDNRNYEELRHPESIQPDGRSARLRFGFSAAEIGRLPGSQQRFWSQMRTVLHDRRLEAVFRTAFREPLRQRFGNKFSTVALRPVPELLRDLKGKLAEVQPGNLKKVISIQFYLPMDDSQKHMGTSCCKRGQEGRYEEVKVLDFIPRSGHAFVVDDHSCHADAGPTSDERPRNSLTLTYFLRER